MFLSLYLSLQLPCRLKYYRSLDIKTGKSDLVGKNGLRLVEERNCDDNQREKKWGERKIIIELTHLSSYSVVQKI